jgi:hypothetical protein
MNKMPENSNVVNNDKPTQLGKQKKKNLRNILKVVTKKPFSIFVRRGSQESPSSASSACGAEQDDQEKVQHISLDKEFCKTTKSKCCVSFATTASTSKTISWRDYSVHEISAAWYSPDEYISIRSDCCKEIIKIDKGEKLQDKKYCSRGLECHTRYARISKSKNRAQSIQVVLQGQESQVRDGRPHDDEAIARAYHDTTSSCQLWATVTGLVDARAAEEVDDIIIAGNASIDDDLSSVTSASSRNCKYYTQRKACTATSSAHGSRQDFPDRSMAMLAAARSA